jgi:hypothetical protein
MSHKPTHDIDLAFEQLMQPRRLADANGDLWLGLTELRQARPQPINGKTRMYPDMQQTCDALRPEFGSGVGEATKRLTYPRQIGFPGRSQNNLPCPSLEQLHP